MRTRKCQSMTRLPMTMRMPASAAWGMRPMTGAMPTRVEAITAAATIPAAGERPPLFKLARVLGVLTSPGTPPTMPEAMLAMPCPTSSRSGRWRTPVMASASSAIISASTEAISARLNAGCMARSRNSGDHTGRYRFGAPRGMAPITGASWNHNAPTSVPAASIASGAGASRRRGPCQAPPTARVIRATATA